MASTFSITSNVAEMSGVEARMDLISGRKAFQRPMGEGIALIDVNPDVYLDPEITIA